MKLPCFVYILSYFVPVPNQGYELRELTENNLRILLDFLPVFYVAVTVV